MLIDIRDAVESKIAEFNQSITLDEIEILGESKLAATISTPHLMGSIEILKELTTDFLIIEFESEDVVYSECYDSLSSSNDLKAVLSSFLNKMIERESNL